MTFMILIARCAEIVCAAAARPVWVGCLEDVALGLQLREARGHVDLSGFSSLFCDFLQTMPGHKFSITI